jgi:hypothetical protein
MTLLSGLLSRRLVAIERRWRPEYQRLLVENFRTFTSMNGFVWYSGRSSPVMLRFAQHLSLFNFTWKNGGSFIMQIDKLPRPDRRGRFIAAHRRLIG